MRTKDVRPGGRVVGGVAAVAAALMLAAVPSFAATSEADYGNVDTSVSGSIIIHKGDTNASTSGDNTGSADGSSAPEGFKGLAGAVFTAYPITSLDLGDSSDWDTLSTLSVPATACTAGTGGGPALEGQTLGAGIVSGATDANGVATIPTSVAAYLVCETTSPSGVVDKAQPFVVTVPYPDSSTKGWLYNVNVFPKNSVATISKTVTVQPSDHLGLGSMVSFPVTSDIPRIAENAQFQYYIVSDPMDSRLGSVGVSSVTVGGSAVNPSYYTVTTDQTAHTVNVSFTQDGLEWLKTQGGKQVVTTFTGTVTSVGDGAIKNQATLYADTKVGDVPPTTPPTTPPTNPPTTPPTTPVVSTNWGDLVIEKTNDSSPAVGLAGATFQVYEAATPYPTDGTCSAGIAAGASAISVGGKTEFTSGPDGKITVAGLFVSDSENAPKDEQSRCYVVKEVAAPAGYVLPTDATTAVSVKIGQTAGVDVTITNTQQHVPSLPLTGANGELLMTIGGLALVLLAGGGALVVRSKRHHN